MSLLLLHVTIQTAEFDGLGRRMKKTVANSGDLDGTTVYFYEGQKICETRDGSGNMVAQFIHGTQYIDELVMMRAADKGDLYVHQDANFNVIGITDLGGSLVERYVLEPYGELTVHQRSSYGDRDGDGDVDATDKGTPGTTCTGTPTAACRILDLDFDGDYDATDATLFDNLDAGKAVHPGRRYSALGQHFGHQGLWLDAEANQYQNRARWYGPSMRRFGQRDPLDNYLAAYGAVPTRVWGGAVDLSVVVQEAIIERIVGHLDSPFVNDRTPLARNWYTYVGSNPQSRKDPTGWATCIDWLKPDPRKWGKLCTREITPSFPQPSEHCCDGDCHVDSCGPACKSFSGFCIYCPENVMCHIMQDLVR